MKFFPAVNFFQFLVIQTLDPDWIWSGIQPTKLDPHHPGSIHQDPKNLSRFTKSDY